MWALRRRLSGAPILLLSVPLLGVARLLPAHGLGLWLRLVAAIPWLTAAGNPRLASLRISRTSGRARRYSTVPSVEALSTTISS